MSFVRTASKEWDSPYPKSSHNQWRCKGILASGAVCGALLGLSDAEHRSLHTSRRDLDRYIHDLGGVAIEAPCRQCGYVNWLFSDNIPESRRPHLKRELSQRSYPYRD